MGTQEGHDFLHFVFCLLCRPPPHLHQPSECGSENPLLPPHSPSGPSTSFLFTVRTGAVFSGKDSQLREPCMPFGARPSGVFQQRETSSHTLCQLCEEIHTSFVLLVNGFLICRMTAFSALPSVVSPGPRPMSTDLHFWGAFDTLWLGLCV